MTRNESPLGEQANSAENYLTKREVAQRLRKSTRSICAYMAAGILPYVKLPGRRGAVLFRWADVEAALQRFTVGK